MLSRFAKIRKTWNPVIRISILVVAWIYLFREVFLKKELLHMWEDFQTRTDPSLLLLLFALAGIFLNYGIEAVKWQRMIRKLEDVSYIQCVKAVLAGITLSLFSPNRIGEFLGRIFMLEKAKRIESSIVTIATNFSQLLVTLLCGVIALWIYPLYDQGFSRFLHQWPVIIIIGLPLLILLPALIAYLNLHNLHLLFPRFPKIFSLIPGIYFRKIQDRLLILQQFKRRDWLISLVLSLIRYQIFAGQFLLVMIAFIPEMHPVEGYLLISLIFLTLTVIPSFTFAEIGIRGSVSLFITRFYFSNHQIELHSQTLVVLSISTLLWLMNIIFPAIVGSLGIFQMKFFRK